MGAWLFDWLETRLGELAIFLSKVFLECPVRFLVSLLILLVKQLYSVGVLSLVIIIVWVTFIGMVCHCKATVFWLIRFGRSGFGSAVSIRIRFVSFSPLVTAPFVCWPSGVFLTAEIGLMKATEQLSAMK